jgi:hypothetical protein
MPLLGLRFSKMDIIPASPAQHSVDPVPFLALGCKCIMDGNFELMKSPVGSTEWCEELVGKRVEKLSKACSAIVALPRKAAALYLLRFQTARMTYTVRTTPLQSCQRAVALADAVTQGALEHIIGETLPADCSARARLPTRLGGLGVTALAAVADAAFLASSYKAGLRAASLWRAPADRPDSQGTGDSGLGDIPGMADAAGRLAARLPRGVVELEEHRNEDDGSFRQQSLSLAATHVEAGLLMARLGPLDAATLQAARAPGAGRWLLAPPAAHGDMSFPNSFLVTAVKQHLGVATLAGSASSAICRYCGSIRDARGIHDRSCSAGGDNVLRHNSVRDCIFRFAERARLNPTLERTGLLAEPGVLLDWRRPADVLIESSDPRASAGPLAADRLAIDVKVINALGPSHFDATLRGPCAAAAAYYHWACAHEQTAARCEAQGISYLPTVFTVQGGFEPRAEALLHQLAAEVASNEGMDEQRAYAEIADEISAILVRAGARATVRRAAQPADHSRREAAAAALAMMARLTATGAAAEEDDDEGDDE